MSILIKGMKMPKDGCHHIICIYADGMVSTGGRAYTAVPVPPHGRLIDADALKVQDGWLRDSKYFSQDSGHTHITFVYSNDICNASAIIEAEDGDLS